MAERTVALACAGGVLRSACGAARDGRRMGLGAAACRRAPIVDGLGPQPRKQGDDCGELVIVTH